MKVKYVGADVHGQTTSFCVRDGSGRIICETVVPTEKEHLLEFVRSLSGEVHLALEEGSQAHWMYGLLRRYVKELIVCDPSKNKPAGHGGNKSDRIDARRLSDLLRKGELSPVFHDFQGLETLKDLVRNYDRVKRDRSRVMNRIKAVFSSRGITADGVRVYSEGGREAFMERLEGRGAREQARTLYVQLDLFTILAKEARDSMVLEARKHTVTRLLRSLPGIGPIRAATILAVVGMPFRFPNKRAVWAYSGFAVVSRSTGDHKVTRDGIVVPNSHSQVTRGLNRNRNPHLKAVFKGAVVPAVRRPEFKAYYEQLLERGLKKKVAKVHVARKLAAITLSLWKKGERYDPTKLSGNNEA